MGAARHPAAARSIRSCWTICKPGGAQVRHRGAAVNHIARKLKRGKTARAPLLFTDDDMTTIRILRRGLGRIPPEAFPILWAAQLGHVKRGARSTRALEGLARRCHSETAKAAPPHLHRPLRRIVANRSLDRRRDLDRPPRQKRPLQRKGPQIRQCRAAAPRRGPLGRPARAPSALEVAAARSRRCRKCPSIVHGEAVALGAGKAVGRGTTGATLRMS